MKVSKFIQQIDTVLDDLRKNKESFSKNIESIKPDEDIDFADWLLLFLSWSELETKEDIQRYYWFLEDEDTNSIDAPS